MKRKASFFFIFLAAVVIVAHSAIPHHHEDGALVICKDIIYKSPESNKVCHYDRTIENHQKNTNSQNNNIDECQLENIYIRLHNDSLNSIVSHINLDVMFFTLPSILYNILFPNYHNNKDIFITYICPIYISFTKEIISLRAPPKY